MGLQRVTAETLGAAFQVSTVNPLVGLEGRASLLRRLGEVMAAQPEVFGQPARPGHLFDFLMRGRNGGGSGQASLQAHDILSALLAHLSPIWPAQNRIEGISLGDCWPHSAAQGAGLSQGWMPFHKLS
ncbi:DUF1688 family protein, partial [Leptospira sp. SA-E8]|uniref:DUF1688 family protein n=1 Tax=Leptospira sp. SA-E8 TaxID=3422259 RepID=UPI003EBB0309